MVLSHEDDESNSHPYWYARIIGAFHALVYYRDPGGNPSTYDPVQVDFAWVRWFGRDLGHRAGWKAKRLHRVGFIPSEDPGAFGFIDPKNIIRGVHLIPAFAFGHTSEYLSPSIIRHPSDNDEDWTYFYLNMFVDRDMLIRFRGGGVGHRTTRKATDGFLSDRDPLDIYHAGTTVFSDENEGAEHDKCDSVDCVGESAAQGEALELQVDENDQSDSDDDYGYSSIQQEVEGGDDDSDDGEEEDNAIEGDEGDEIDDELGAEDGEDSDGELEAFSGF
ncbi:hypothetical protein P692DRAFT_20811012 [Suillus brevipes Sb2]|nr:hypothetical protein P692DRAFT_20811012 [Suillus brevipes Sb2]